MATNALELLVDDYLAHCLSVGRKRNTVEGAYGYPLRQVFLPWCAEHAVSEVAELTTRTIERYQADLLTKGGVRKSVLSPSTVHSYVRVVNQMLAWARHPESEIEGVPNGQAKLPKLPRTVKDVLSRAEIERLEDAVSAERDRLIVRVLGDCGVRVGELVKLRTDDLVMQDRKRFLHVRGKGDLDRLVPIIDPSLWRRLQRFARSRPNGDRLFLGLKRRTAHDELAPLTASGVQQMIRQARHDAGITKRVHPHLFRYSAATWMRKKGVDPLTIARVMGWTSLRMLQRIYDQTTALDDFDAMVRQLRTDDQE